MVFNMPIRVLLFIQVFIFLVPFIYLESTVFANEVRVDSPSSVSRDNTVLPFCTSTEGQNKKCGYMDSQGLIVVEPVYGYTRDFIGEFSVTYSDGKHGLVNKNGRILSEPIYSSIYQGNSFSNSPKAKTLISVGQNGNYRLLNSKGEDICGREFDREVRFYNDYAVVEEPHPSNAMYMIDHTCKVVIPDGYSHIGDVSDGLVMVSKRINGGDKSGYLDTTGKQVIEFKYDTASKFKNGVAKVGVRDENDWHEKTYKFIDKSGKEVLVGDSRLDAQRKVFSNGKKDRKKLKFGLRNGSGKTIIAPRYSYIGDFKNGLAIVRVKDKKGFIDKNGNELTGFVYSDVVEFSDGLAAVKKDGEWGFIDKSGELVIPIQYNAVRMFSYGLALVKLGNRWGIIDKNNKQVMPPINAVVSTYINGYARVEFGNKSYQINTKGEPIGFDFSNMSGEQNYIVQKGVGLVEVDSDNSDKELLPYCAEKNKCGYLDKKGNIVLKPIYYATRRFDNGLARVEKAYGRNGLINKNGDVILPFIYDSIEEPFISRETEVRKVAKKIGSPLERNKTYGLIAKDGKIICAPIYDRLHYKNGYAVVTKNNKKIGLVDESCELALPIGKYEEFGFYAEGLVPAKKDGKWGYINLRAEKKIDFKYSAASHFIDGTAVVTKAHFGGFKTSYFIDTEGSVKAKYGPTKHYIHTGNMLEIKQGVFRVYSDNGKVGLLDLAGKLILPVKYSLIERTQGNNSIDGPLLRIKRDGKFGLFDPELKKIVLPALYEAAYVYDEEYFSLNKDKMWGVLDVTGKEVIKFEQQFIGRFVNGLATVKTNNQTGLMNLQGELIKKFDYDWIQSFYGTLALVRKDDKYCYINLEGKEVAPCVFDRADRMYDGYAKVTYKGGQYWLDSDGKPIGFEYE